MAMSVRNSLCEKIRTGELHCEKELTMSILSGKYKVVILWHLGHDGAMRYADIHRLFNDISNRILTKQLRELEQDFVITRQVYPEAVVRVEYSLTEIGLSLMPIIDSIYEWGKAHLEFYIAREQEALAKKRSS